MDYDEKDNDNLGSFYMGRTRIRPNRPKRQLPPGILTAAVLLIFMGVVWYAYPSKDDKYTDMDVPVVEADGSSTKEIPTDPRGMEVRHQDSTIFETIENSAKKKDAKVVSGKKGAVENILADDSDANGEKILPKEEEPMDKKIILESKGVLNGFAQEPRTAPDANKIVDKVELVDYKDTDSKKSDVAVKDVKKPAEKSEPKQSIPDSAKDTKIQLGSYREKADAEKDWLRLQKKFPELLGKLNKDIIEVDLKTKGIYNRLQAGKVTKEQAKNICTQINEQKPGGCLIVK